MIWFPLKKAWDKATRDLRRSNYVSKSYTLRQWLFLLFQDMDAIKESLFMYLEYFGILHLRVPLWPGRVCSKILRFNFHWQILPHISCISILFCLGGISSASHRRRQPSCEFGKSPGEGAKHRGYASKSLRRLTLLPYTRTLITLQPLAFLIFVWKITL